MQEPREFWFIQGLPEESTRARVGKIFWKGPDSKYFSLVGHIQFPSFSSVSAHPPFLSFLNLKIFLQTFKKHS